MLISRRVIDARAQQMVAHLIHQVNALVEEKAVLKRELARPPTSCARLLPAIKMSARLITRT